MKKCGVLLATLNFVSILIAATPSFQGLGHLWEYDKNSSAYGVSSDGSTIVGMSAYEAGMKAVRWNSNQMDVLGDWPSDTNYSHALDATSDGSVIVGEYMGNAAYWENGSMTMLPSIGTNNSARGVSADGSVIVGDGQQPLIWKNGAVSVLKDLSGNESTGTAHAVSNDGLIAVGNVMTPSGNEAVCWDIQNGTTFNLGSVLENHNDTLAFNISPDGTKIVGHEGYTNYQESFIWEDGVMIGLGRLDGYGYKSQALAVSNNGIVVGVEELAETENSQHEHAYIWDETFGIRDLKEVLIGDYGLDLTGWQLLKAYDISADGKVIVGSGVNPDGFYEAWVATIPEPASIFLLSLGVLLIRNKSNQNNYF